MADIEAIREHHAYVTDRTPAPWRWAGHDYNDGGNDIYLATESHGRVFVMGFARRGFSGAQPMFQVWQESEETGRLSGQLVKASEGLIVRERDYRSDIADIDNPHAEYLKRAPEYVETLLAEIDRLEEELKAAQVTPVGKHLKEPGGWCRTCSIHHHETEWARIHDGLAEEDRRAY